MDPKPQSDRPPTASTPTAGHPDPSAAISRRGAILAAASTAAAAWALPSVAFAQAPRRRARVLFFTRSQGFEHDAVKRVDGQLGFGERILSQLGLDNGYDVVVSKDGTMFTPQTLQSFDAVVFYTTGDLTREGGDNAPPMSADGKQALLDAIAAGKGFLGIHSATDTFRDDPNDPYIRMIGGRFVGHGDQQTATQRVASPGFAGLDGLEDFSLHEEWYALDTLAKDMHVILVQETDGMKEDLYGRPAFPATWARTHGKGRVFYTSLGHREDVFAGPQMRKILLAGLAYTTGQSNPDTNPNAEAVGADVSR